MILGNKMKCYFAHPFVRINHPEKFRIIKTLELRDVDVLDPFIGEEEINSKYGHTEYFHPTITDRFKLGQEIWKNDIDRLTKCDMILAWLPVPSTGVAMELWEAFRQHKFIQIIAPNQHPAFAYIMKNGRNQQFKDVNDFMTRRKMIW